MSNETTVDVLEIVVPIGLVGDGIVKYFGIPFVIRGSVSREGGLQTPYLCLLASSCTEVH